jgi:hypothetical protein
MDNWTTLVIDDQNKGSYPWNTETLPDGEYYLRFTATDNSPEKLYVVYESIDSIEIDNELSILVVAPNQGETWSGTKDIIWQIQDPHGETIYINIQYRKSSDSPNEWKDLTTEKITNTGTLKWDTNSVPNGDYFIRVYGYVTVGSQREGEAISPQFRVKNEEDEAGFFDSIFAWILILVIIIVIVCAVVFLIIRKKKREEELKKEAKDLKTKDFTKPPEVPLGPQMYTVHPTAPPPLFPVEQQRYQPIPPPPLPPIPPPQMQVQPPTKPPETAGQTGVKGDAMVQPEENIQESEAVNSNIDDNTDLNADENVPYPNGNDTEKTVPKIKNPQ